MKPKILLVALVCMAFLAKAYAQRPSFDKSKDILIACFDIKPDPDDIHAVAALGSMLVHPDLNNVNYFAVAGAYGSQGGSYLQSNSLFNLAFGNNWTDAHSNRSAALTAITNKVVPVLQNGGKVWVQEGGQSDVTADWLMPVINANNGISSNTTKNNVIVVQHDDGFNEGNTNSTKLSNVKANTNYFLLDDGNAGWTASWGDHGPWSTPMYRNQSSSYVDQAKNSPNTVAKTLWTEADLIFNNYFPNGFPHDWSFFFTDGVDYSDCVENWWIFEIGSDADTHDKFWSRYVMNTDSNNPPTGTDSVSCANLPSSITSSNTISVSVPYEASQSRDVVVEFWDTGWIKQGKTTVSSGSGTATVTISLDNAPATGSNYLFKTSIRPVNGNWQTNIDACQKTNVTVGSGNNNSQTPFGGTAATIPGTIEVENFDNGGQGIAYNDTDTANNGPNIAREDEGVDIEARDGGQTIGWTANGEWLEYTVNATAGTYTLEARVATTTTGKSIVAKLDSATLGTFNLPNTGGWGTFQTISIPNIAVSGGNGKILRLEFVGGGANVNWVKFTSDGSNNNCNINWTSPNQSISKTTLNWTSPAIDISCATSVNISMDIEGLTPAQMEASDYLNIYYSVDGGAQIAISENTDGFALKTISANNVSGNSLEIIINGKTSWQDETYNINNISVQSNGTAKDASTKENILSDSNDKTMIYPNPILPNESFNILLGNTNTIKQISIFEYTGKLIYSTQTNKDRIDLNMSKLSMSRGLYLVKIDKNSNSKTLKLIVK